MRTATLPRKYKKAYTIGGQLDPNDPTQLAATSTQKTTGMSSSMGTALASGAQLVSSVADALDKGNSHGHQSGITTGLKQGASMAASGAAIGSVIPGVGTLAGGVIGGAIGLTEGLIGSASAHAQDRAEDRYADYNRSMQDQANGQAMIAQDKSLVYGRKGAQVYAYGGPIRPSVRDTSARFNMNQLGMNPMAPLSARNPLMVDKGNGVIGQWGNPLDSTKAPVPFINPMLIAPSDKATGKSNYFYPSGSNSTAPTPATIHRSSYANGGMMKAYADGGQMETEGGSLTPMNSQAVEVNGQSHAQGGVQLPQAEVEGGETIANGFVFSKSLGFADLHKPIAKAMGKIEDKPMDPVRRKTMNILKGREQGLMLSQEFLKQRMGIPSDLNT